MFFPVVQYFNMSIEESNFNSLSEEEKKEEVLSKRRSLANALFMKIPSNAETNSEGLFVQTPNVDVRLINTGEGGIEIEDMENHLVHYVNLDGEHLKTVSSRSGEPVAFSVEQIENFMQLVLEETSK